MSDSILCQAELQAMQWQARLSSDLIEECHLREFDAWLAERPEHLAAWSSVNEFWLGLDNVSLEEVIGNSGAGVLEFPRPKASKSRRRYHKTAFALAASLLLAVSLLYRHFDYYLADYRTATGQQQTIRLSDGSTVQLNTDSAVSVELSENRRLVTLHRGEAYFKVAADRARPFVVKTEAGLIRALGTAFDVRQLDRQTVDVTVFEHAVKVTTTDGRVEERLAEAEHLLFSHDRLSAAMPANLQQAGAWHLQRMMFRDKPLAEVVAELERYRPGKILVISDEIGKLPITGVFDIGNTGAALQAIAESLPVKVGKMTERLVLLSAE